MIAFLRKNLVTVALVGTLALAGASGFFASQALGVGQQTPTRTVTINVATGERGPIGPPGPVGPAGPPGGEKCPSGFSFGDVVINHPQGQITILTCIKD